MKGYPGVKKLCLLAPTVLLGTAAAQDDGADDALGAVTVRLIGYNEVPSVSTPARGMFSAQVDEAASTITYTLQYDQLSGDVTQAHLHLGERHTNGGISVWLCSNLTDPAPPPGTQACPPGPAEITGTITPEQVGGRIRGSPPANSRKCSMRSAPARSMRTCTRLRTRAARSAGSCSVRATISTIRTTTLPAMSAAATVAVAVAARAAVPAGPDSDHRPARTGERGD